MPALHYANHISGPSRELKGVHHRASNYRGKERKHSLNFPEELVKDFRKVLKDKKGSEAKLEEALTRYMEWVVGVDCPDSPYIDEKSKEELLAEYKGRREAPPEYSESPARNWKIQ